MIQLISWKTTPTTFLAVLPPSWLISSELKAQMWYSGWHKSHSHPSQGKAAFQDKDTFCERLNGVRREQRQTKRGQWLVLSKLKSPKQVSLFQLAEGMTTSSQWQPVVCLGSVDLFNPQRAVPTAGAWILGQFTDRKGTPTKYFEVTNHLLLL